MFNEGIYYVLYLQILRLFTQKRVMLKYIHYYDAHDLTHNYEQTTTHYLNPLESL